MKKKDVFDKLISRCLPNFLAESMLSLPNDIKARANELRLRVNRPIVITLDKGYYVLNEYAVLSAVIIDEVFNNICEHSIYSHQDELQYGFVTLDGGHRAGICGTASKDINGTRTCHNISSINIRIANEHIGCGNEIARNIFADGLCSVIIAGPPCSGKTTILRDLTRILSSKPYMKKTAVVDERGEIAAVHNGQTANDLGFMYDVLDKYPKGEGIMIALRTLSPDVIICDEIGGQDDADALCQGVNAGVNIITSIHACNANELYSRKQCRIIMETNAFQRVVFLKGGNNRGVIDKIIDV